MTKDRTGRRRRWWLVLLLLAALPVVAIAILVLSLRLEIVRHAILQRVGTAVQERTGWQLEIEDATFRPLLGDVLLRNLSVSSAAGERPFLTAERVSFRLVLTSLFGDRPRLRTLSVDELVVDLDLLPPSTPPQEGEEAKAIELPVDIDRLVVRRGSVRAAPGNAAAGWADQVRLDDVHLAGRLGAAGMALDFGGRIDAEGPRLGSRQATVEGQVTGTLAMLHVNDLSVAGPGLDLTADLQLGLDPDAPLTGSFELAADLSRLLEQEGGRIEASGSLDLRQHTGRLDATVDALAGSLVAPWIPAELADRYRLEDTRADAEVAIRALAGEPLTGTMEVHWRRGARAMLEAQAEIRDGRVDWNVEPRLDTLDGTLVAHAEALPAEVLGPWFDSAEARDALSGGSLDLDLEAELRSEREDPLSATASLAWQGTGDRRLELRLTQLAGRATADGGLDPTSLVGQIDSQVHALPAELLLPWIGPDLFGRLGAAETTFELAGRLALERTSRNPMSAELTATWSETAGPILVASVRSAASRREARGRLDPDSMLFDIGLVAPGLPDERLAAALGSDLAELLAVAGTHVEADASFVVGRRGFGGDGGRAHARWLDAGGVELLTLDAATGGDGTFTVAVAADLLPASPGSRHLSGTIRTAEWATLANAAVDDGRLEIRLPDLAAAVEELRLRWPALQPFVAPPDGASQPSILEAALRGDLEATASFAGPLLDPAVELDAGWRPHPGATVRLAAQGRPLRPDVTASLAIEGVSLQALTTELSGLVAGTVQASVDEGGWTGSLGLAADGLEVPASGLCLNHLSLAATSDGRSLQLDSLVAQHRGTRLAASGALALSLPPDWAELTVTVQDPDGGLEYVALDLAVADGVARLESRDLRSRLGSGRLTAVVPLAALARIEGMPPTLAEAWRSDAGATVAIDVLLPVVDSRDLAPFLTESVPWRVQGEDIRLALELEPDDLSGARGTLEIGDLLLETTEHTVGTMGPLRLQLARHRLDLTPIRAALDGRPFDIRGYAALERDALAIADLRFTATGNVDLGLLDPLLLGGVGSGPLAIEARLGGPPSALDGRLLLDGSGGRIDYLTPYVSRIADPRVEVTLLQGTVQITEATARLNEGALDVTGSWTSSEGLFLDTSFDDVRYRLDYGLSALLDGNLELRLPFVEARRGSIEGEIVVERGLVRRNVDLERELLRQLLAAELEGADTTGEEIDLDIRLLSRQGIRVRNNVADLRATWTPIRVRGTLAEPTLDGTVDIDPGGQVFAYGQTLRIDRGSLTLRPEPGAEPVLDLATTASYEDPSITRRGASRNLDRFTPPPISGGPEEEIDRAEAATAGLKGYFADRLSESAEELLSSTPLAGAGLSIRPVVVYNEGDPSAHLTVGRDLTENLTLAISIDMQQAQQRTYLLQVDDLPGLSRLQGQVFTNEQNNPGATLQQTLSFGGGDSERQVGKIHIGLPDGSGLDAGALRRAISVESREPLPDGVEFDTEIEVSDALRRRGYYSANVTVTTREAKRSNRTDVVVQVEPGPRTEVVFEGDRPPNRRRSAIATLYRSDYYERASLEEMRAQTRRTLRGEGYLDPEVDVVVERAAADEGGAPRRVVVSARGGRRVDPAPPRLPGVEPEIEQRVQERFPTREARIELAAEEEGALATVRSVLRNFGYAEARVVDCTLAEDGVDLAVVVEPGPRRTIERIEITGVDEERARELAALLTVAPEEPVRSSRLVSAAITLEDELRQEGFSEARVRTLTRPIAGPSEGPEVAAVAQRPTVVEFRVDSGPRYRLAEIELEGARKTRERWATSITELEPGETFTRTDLLDLRRRLYQTGIFSSVYVNPRLHEDGNATLVIGVDERPPVTFGYGLRWESDEGAGVVLDVLDRNTLGRGIALGARALYTRDNQFGRIYSELPYFLGSRYTLETFLELRNELDVQDLPFKEQLLSLQLARGFGRYTTGRAYARYLRQVTTIDDFFFGRFEDTQVTPSLGVQAIFNRRSDPLSGRSGLFASADLSGSGDFLGSDRDYLRFFGQVNLYRPAGRLFGRRLGWAQSFRLGVADAFDDQLLPDKSAFRAGGEYSIRGYSAASLGPRDPFTGREVGGNALMVLNEELHFPITSIFSGLLFVDVGNVWEKVGDVDLELFSSVGTGLRVDSPIGLLRLDVAFPLDRREDDAAVKFYFGFGQVF